MVLQIGIPSQRRIQIYARVSVSTMGRVIRCQDIVYNLVIRLGHDSKLSQIDLSNLAAQPQPCFRRLSRCIHAALFRLANLRLQLWVLQGEE